MTATGPSARRLEHVALLHQGPAELAERVVPVVADAIGRRAAVLVALDGEAWGQVAGRLGDRARHVTYLSADVRYSRPATAMAVVHRFVADALDAGASSVCSVGSLPLAGDEGAARWVRYEAAVNDVLGHLPIHAVCAYDTAATPPTVLDAVRRTHEHVHDAGGRRPSDDYRGGEAALDVAAAVAEPGGHPDVAFVVGEVAAVRQALTSAFADRLAADRLADAHLVATELVTNGFRHGQEPVTFSAWSTGGGVVVQVVDCGPGITDPYADLRPPAGRVGGYGLWLAGQLADVSIRHDAGRTIVTAALG